MSNEGVSTVERMVSPGPDKKLASVGGGLVSVSGAFVLFTAYGIPDWFVILLGLVGIGAVLLSMRGKLMPTGQYQPPKVGGGVGGVLIMILAVAVILAGIEMIQASPSTQGNTPTAAPGQLGYTITWSAQTTDVLASPYTACTSQTPFSSNAAKTVAGYMWAAQSSNTGEIVTFNGNNAAFTDYAGDQVAVASGGGKLSTNAGTCWQVKGILTYTSGVPGASGGGAVGLPIWVGVQSMAYNVAQGGQAQRIDTQVYNNGTVVNTPMWQSVGGNDFPITVKDGAGGQDPLCPGFRNIPTLTAATSIANGGCAIGSGSPGTNGWDVNVARSTGAITFYVLVSMGDAGPFGYSSSGTQDAPIGSSIVLTFQVGIPQAWAYTYGGGSYYTPSLATMSITLSRSAA